MRRVWQWIKETGVVVGAVVGFVIGLILTRRRDVPNLRDRVDDARKHARSAGTANSEADRKLTELRDEVERSTEQLEAIRRSNHDARAILGRIRARGPVNGTSVNHNSDMGHRDDSDNGGGVPVGSR